STSLGSAIALAVLILLLGIVIRVLTRNELLANGICLVCVIGLLIIYVADTTLLEGLLPAIMKQLSLFERFSVFVNGIFDMTAIVYYLTVIVFFLFLSVQSLEKRRYN
ncbi:MAG: ABC transporter, partial [Peptococcaceae bacterium]